MRSDGQCRSCHKEVRWVVTEPSLKRMPLDPIPAPDGNMWIDRIEGGVPVMRVALNADGVPASVPLRYVSHFVTCPDRDDWRRP